jgi:hypothetical protein
VAGVASLYSSIGLLEAQFGNETRSS